MAAKAGRKCLFYWKALADTEYSLATGLTTKSLSLANGPIDTTTDDDNGFRTSLSDVSGTRSCDFKVSGILKDQTLLAHVGLEASLDVRLVFPGVAHIDVEARFTAAELSADMEDAAKFDYSFASSGSFSIGNGTPT